MEKSNYLEYSSTRFGSYFHLERLLRRIAMAAVPTFSASHLVTNSALGRPGRVTLVASGCRVCGLCWNLETIHWVFYGFFRPISIHFLDFVCFSACRTQFSAFLSQAASFCRIQSVSGWLVTVTTLLRCFKTPK